MSINRNCSLHPSLDSAPEIICDPAEDRTSLGWCSPEFQQGCVIREDSEESK